MGQGPEFVLSAEKQGWVVGMCTHNFIDDTLVGVEVEGQARIAGNVVRVTALITTRRWEAHYFSMRTREALLTVFVRTRPYKLLGQSHAFRSEFEAEA